jgi:hypothetical protein
LAPPRVTELIRSKPAPLLEIAGGTSEKQGPNAWM